MMGSSHEPVYTCFHMMHITIILVKYPAILVSCHANLRLNTRRVGKLSITPTKTKYFNGRYE